MVSRRVSRSVRRLVGGLVVLAFLAAVAAPAQAASGAWSAPNAPASQVLEWIKDVLADLGFFTPEPDEPENLRVIFGKDSCGADPNGSTCPENEVASPPPLSGLQEDV